MGVAARYLMVGGPTKSSIRVITSISDKSSRACLHRARELVSPLRLQALTAFARIDRLKNTTM